MTEDTSVKQFDLADRTLKFARDTRDFTKLLPRSISNIEYVKQLIRSSASVGANYIEANESLSKKDFVMRVKISRKETKESIYWLNLVDVSTGAHENKRLQLIQEATEIMKIFGAIITKSQ